MAELAAPRPLLPESPLPVVAADPWAEPPALPVLLNAPVALEVLGPAAEVTPDAPAAPDEPPAPLEPVAAKPEA